MGAFAHFSARISRVGICDRNWAKSNHSYVYSITGLTVMRILRLLNQYRPELLSNGIYSSCILFMVSGNRIWIVPPVLTEKSPEGRLLSVRGLLACLVILCLTVTLANRTVHISASDQLTVSSVSAAKIQHRDKDSLVWVCLLAALPMLRVPGASFTHQPSDRELLDLHYESLHNRPPPIS